MDKLLICTTYKFVYFDGNKPHILHEGDLGEGTGHYTGITWDDDGVLYLAGTIDTRYIIHRFVDSDLHELPLIPEDRNLLHETHQIMWIDGLLYVVNTGMNRIEVFDGESWRSKAWNPAPCDIDHISGIWSDGRYIYVVELPQKVWGRSIIRKCEMESLDLLDTIDIGPHNHNVYVERGTMYSLKSYGTDDGSCPAILIVDNKKVSRIDKPAWGKALIRGLARTEDYWYVGMSRWETDRSKRHGGDAIVIQLDNDFNEIDRVLMRGYGQLCDVRVVGENDLAHNGIFMDELRDCQYVSGH